MFGKNSLEMQVHHQSENPIEDHGTYAFKKNKKKQKEKIYIYYSFLHLLPLPKNSHLPSVFVGLLSWPSATT